MFFIFVDVVTHVKGSRKVPFYSRVHYTLICLIIAGINMQEFLFKSGVECSIFIHEWAIPPTHNKPCTHKSMPVMSIITMPGIQ